VPVMAALAALVIFVYVLRMQGTSKRDIMSSRVQALGDHGERELKSTVFVEERGQLVRRSTRCGHARSTALMHHACKCAAERWQWGN
jgi:hypothetical protein